MDNTYGDDLGHEFCKRCGYCIVCGDCERYGCGLDKSRDLKHGT